jgi:hypothetical protein
MRVQFFVTALLSLLPSFIDAANITCPKTPTPWPAASTYPSMSTLPDPFLYLDQKSRVQSNAEWYACRQPEIMQLLQQYQYGFYPDHSAENVTATRTGNTVSISVTAGGKTGSFKASIILPTANTVGDKSPVVIAIGGIDNGAYTKNGIAVVTFDYTTVSPDSNGKTGAFWALYNGRDIGSSSIPFLPTAFHPVPHLSGIFKVNKSKLTGTKGVLTAWAWGFHRVLDALILTAPEIDPTKVGVTGCSRLGKAALAAGLFDTRITVTMAMSSGVQGLGPYRYTTLSGQGENLENSKSGAGWWSNSVLGTFVNQAERLPFDAHTIAAALAPRALVIDQGTGDQFTNSKGTAIVIYPAAEIVFNWLGVPDQIAMAIRSGAHCDNSG